MPNYIRIAGTDIYLRVFEQGDFSFISGTYKANAAVDFVLERDFADARVVCGSNTLPDERFYFTFEGQKTNLNNQAVWQSGKYPVIWGMVGASGAETVYLAVLRGGYNPKGSAMNYYLPVVTSDGVVFESTNQSTAYMPVSELTVYENNPNFVHQCKYDATVINPTCNTSGYTEYVCAECGNSYISDETAPLGHTYEIVVTEPTCTSGGFTSHTCLRCEYNYTDAITNPIGHSYIGVLTKPTCIESGYTTYSCDSCNDSYISDTVDPTGHDWGDWEVSVAPTYTSTGEKMRTCRNCGEIETAIVEKLSIDKIMGIALSKAGVPMAELVAQMLYRSAPVDPDDPVIPDTPTATQCLYGHVADNGNIGLRSGDTVTLYDGAVLPALLEWDKEQYPYALMYSAQKVYGFSGYEEIYFLSDRPYCDGNNVCVPIGTAYVTHSLNADGTGWDYEDTITVSYGTLSGKRFFTWSSHDVLNSDGSVYLQGTSPIPVTDMVGYSYNGTVLPELPEWDKSVYPHVTISKSADSLYQLKAGKSAYNNIDAGFISIEQVDDKYINSNCHAPFDSWNDPVTVYIGPRVDYDELVWTNLNIEGIMDGSDPIPVYESAVEPIAWSYNGVVLPELPESDLPYALVRYCYTDSDGYPNVGSEWVYFSSTQYRYIKNAIHESIRNDSDDNGEVYLLKDGEWTTWDTFGSNSLILSVDGEIMNEVRWCNHDILRTADSTVYLQGTDPIPVYE